ncbi:hypothetical protein C8R44DRAFT_578268, partial [Mycena epipterygia]
YHLALLQEPYIDHLNESRTNPRFISVYPTPHKTSHERSRSLILVNSHLSSSSWTQIPIDSSEMTAIELRGDFGTVRVFNLY